ncbi:MAG TPA: ABC transporter permease [Dinghuibacter sp.]|uniref:ABC transporter permease n=1 Tax=Dinghuibacter sp. TaxID=2024697 RepID=UPI002BD5B6CE|nr:ABC transporter permease [Dinghuibacter sp.]HTJ13191.1 ABC transporter permease [Dinghuibacter sp.]
MLIANYLTVAWRNLMKSKAFSFINVFGLSVGLTCCMLITLYILHETSYDRYQRNGDRLYQLGTTFISEGVEHRQGATSAPVGPLMQQVFPQIERTARLRPLFEDKTLFQYHTATGEFSSIFEEKGGLADSGFFRVFTYNFIEGSAETSMDDPYGIVLSEDIAHQLFGSGSALGKVIHISSSTNGDHDYAVTGVFRPIGKPSHIDMRFFMSMYGGNYGDFLKKTTNLANNNQFDTYFLLRPGARASDLERQFPAFVDTYEGKDLKQAGFYKKQFLTKVSDIHLYARSEDGYDVTQEGSVTALYILGSIALFTLLIACINFMNLATARSVKRASEVGVRKALGAGRMSLIWQFMGEALLMSLIAFGAALLMAELSFRGFEYMAGKDIHLTAGELWRLGGIYFGLAILTGIISGSYPAFYLSSFQPVRTMKGKGSQGLAATSLRKGLVIVQFIISITLIVASVVINKQMTFIKNTDLGFTKDHQLVIPLRGSSARQLHETFQAAIANDPHVLSAGASFSYPGIDNFSDRLLYAEGKSLHDAYDIKVNFADYDFLKTIGVRVLAGRVFSRDFPSDTLDGIVINERAMKEMGLTLQNAIGHRLVTEFQGNKNFSRVVGVVGDFNFATLHTAIEGYSIMLQTTPYNMNYLVVHLAPGDPGPTIRSIERTWKQLDPNEPFEYTFLDQEFQKNYDADTRLADIVALFTAIAIAISCLGLLGLAAFSAEQRTKEIGIRKVLGASPAGIVAMLSGDFLKLVAISILVASPIAWLVMRRWLQNFAFKTTIDWSVFALTAAAALLIALITISTQAIRAAITSPVKSLRSE